MVQIIDPSGYKRLVPGGICLLEGKTRKTYHFKTEARATSLTNYKCTGDVLYLLTKRCDLHIVFLLFFSFNCLSVIKVHTSLNISNKRVHAFIWWLIKCKSYFGISTIYTNCSLALFIVLLHISQIYILTRIYAFILWLLNYKNYFSVSSLVVVIFFFCKS